MKHKKNTCMTLAILIAVPLAIPILMAILLTAAERTALGLAHPACVRAAAFCAKAMVALIGYVLPDRLLEITERMDPETDWTPIVHSSCIPVTVVIIMIYAFHGQPYAQWTGCWLYAGYMLHEIKDVLTGKRRREDQRHD